MCSKSEEHKHALPAELLKHYMGQHICPLRNASVCDFFWVVLN